MFLLSQSLTTGHGYYLCQTPEMVTQNRDIVLRSRATGKFLSHKQNKSKKSILFYSIENFSHQHSLMVFHCSLSDSKSPQISRTLLSILADLNNVVIWMVSTRPLISMGLKKVENFIVILFS